MRLESCNPNNQIILKILIQAKSIRRNQNQDNRNCQNQDSQDSQD